MTILQFEEIVGAYIARTGYADFHVIMSAYTLNSILREVESRLYAVPAIKPSDHATILGYPVFLNEQVPYDVAYPMCGSKPCDPKEQYKGEL
jgi:hypothetical protein